MELYKLEDYTGQLMDVARFHDYCPNGVQVEGRPEVFRLVSGVTASLDLLKAAIGVGADAILVHHGYFWKNEDARITGVKRARIEFLLRHNVSLLAYHLPLDAHPVLGNNAQLAQKLEFVEEGRFGEQSIACHGALTDELPLCGLGERVTRVLGRAPLIIGDGDTPVRRIAWCSGAAQGYFEEAIRLGVDAFLTGEISEQCVHLARETGVGFIAAGHHATERYGVQALGAHLAQQFCISHQFVDIDNPV
ncbi:metal-binding protein [Sulfuricella sp. T08]|uniref:Nif3-like dinuclear metal center hexameric protein n=1 Tax=Sulfuricella sp. T08 TaxID=1632857 RepID=UPI0006179F70|nr:Nif3-like dinuclear metal center hexameric protein [Sulfuricella sp. T08]GAO35858.1 metal-binding protein [Sulfuricella sp. T08]